MIKKVFAILIASVLILTSALTAGAYSNGMSKEEYIEYMIQQNGCILSGDGEYIYQVYSDGTIVLKCYFGEAENLVIPEYVDGKKVKDVIGGYYFIENNSKTVSITFPETFDGCIMLDAYNCTALETMYFNNTVDSSDYVQIGGQALKKAVFGGNMKRIPEHICSGETFGEIVLSEGIEEISENAFVDLKGVKSITIPSTVKKIGDSAFRAINSLEEVTYNSSADIPDYCFVFNSKLKTFNLNGNVKSIGKHAFEKCTELKSFPFKTGLEKIGERAFFECSALENADLPDGVKTIEENAFFQSGVTSVTLPSSLETMGIGTFFGCSNLSKPTLCDGLKSFGGSTFAYSGIKEITIPESVTAIEAGAFGGCSGLTDIKIPDSVKKIGMHAFSNSGLKEIIIPSSVNEIGRGAFSGCESLKKVRIPDSVTVIHDYTFNECTALDDINLPSKLTEIGKAAFQKDASLKSIDLPETLTRIYPYAFNKCSGIGEVTLPEAATYVGYRAFGDTEWLDKQPDGMVYLGKVLYTFKGTVPENTDIEIKDGTKGIAGAAFTGQKNLRSVTMPDTVETICDGAFENCHNLESVYISNSLTGLYPNVFRNCRALREIMLPDSVNRIWNESMYGCTSLEVLRMPENIRSVGTALDETKSLKTIYGYIDTYAQKYAAYRKVNFIPLSNLGTPVEKGDANGDGVININDATAIQQSLAMIKTINPGLNDYADVNSDGAINVADATAIQKITAKIL